jgi:hypothetical protein
MIRRRFYRSSAILATSLAAIAPKPYSKASSPKKEKSEHRGASLAKPIQGSGGSPNPPPSIPSVLNPISVSQPFSPLIPSPYGPITPLGPSTTLPGPLLKDGGPYPWRTDIVTTTFWVGETAAKNNPVPNDKSSWDVKWAKNYGGTDSPERAARSGYIPAAFTPGQNPFYVALPYNDVQASGHKPEAAQVIPWFKREYKGPGKTVLKGRWIAVRFKIGLPTRSGRIADRSAQITTLTYSETNAPNLISIRARDLMFHQLSAITLAWRRPT